jgi:antitoxin HicB
MKTAKHKNIGDNFDDFLKEEGILDEVEALAFKRVVSFQIQQEMESRKLSKADMAIRMNTSRSVLYRLLNPDDTGITLNTLTAAAKALGKRLRIEFA